MDKFLIIDGMNLLFQMFYGMPSRITNSKGMPIQGVLGFVGALRKIIQRVNPTHIVAIFDGETHNPRTDLNPEYKANRVDYSQVPETDNPFCQLPFVYSALELMGVQYAETCDCEADDVIASYVKAYPNCERIVCSFDSDFFQLIDDNVSVLRYRGDKTAILTPPDIIAKLGISPSMYAHHKALMGDNSDNIKGVPKVGVKTAAELVNTFGGIENIICRFEDIKKPSIRESVKNSQALIRENYRLIYLCGDASLPYDMKDCEYSHCFMTTNEILLRIGIL